MVPQLRLVLLLVFVGLARNQITTAAAEPVAMTSPSRQQEQQLDDEISFLSIQFNCSTNQERKRTAEYLLEQIPCCSYYRQEQQQHEQQPSPESWLINPELETSHTWWCHYYCPDCVPSSLELVNQE